MPQRNELKADNVIRTWPEANGQSKGAEYLVTKSQAADSVTKKLPNVYKSCQRMISLEKCKILTPLQKLPKNLGDLGKLFFAIGFKKLLKVP